jgi:hypothetical protein
MDVCLSEGIATVPSTTSKIPFSDANCKLVHQKIELVNKKRMTLEPEKCEGHIHITLSLELIFFSYSESSSV